ALTGIAWKDLRLATNRLASLLDLEGQGPHYHYRLFHGSFQDFLCHPALAGDFWVDPAEFHLRIAGYYWSKYRDMWSACDLYGLRNAAIHYERGIQAVPKPRRHELVEQLVGVATDPDFQAAHEEHLRDPFLLDSDLARATRVAVCDEDPQAPH